MDIEALASSRKNEWEKLDNLAARGKPTGQQADELVVLYRRAANDLARVQAENPDSRTIARLSLLINRTRGRLTRAGGNPLAALAVFIQVHLPAALYRIRWWTFGCMSGFIALAVISGWWTVSNPHVLATLGSPSELDQYANKAFAAYYSNNPAPEFAAQVWTNNARIAVICIAFGITGVGPLYMLFENAVGVGSAGAIMASRDSLQVFFGLILPHGFLELTAIFIAAGAGLKIFWTVLVPGPRPRLQALAEEGRAIFVIAVGLVGILAWSGAYEGFLTPSELPVILKVVIGGASLALLWFYILFFGYRAVKNQQTGDLTEDEAGYVAPVNG